MAGWVEVLALSLSIETSPLTGPVVEISPCGEVDVDTAHEVKDAVSAVLARSRPVRIELDMSGVTFLDSVGISAMVAAFQLASVSGVKLAVTRPSRFVHRQLWITGLLGLFGAPDPHVPRVAPAAAGRTVRTA
jgi:anti-anti-sigma factor